MAQNLIIISGKIVAKKFETDEKGFTKGFVDITQVEPAFKQNEEGKWERDGNKDVLVRINAIGDHAEAIRDADNGSFLHLTGKWVTREYTSPQGMTGKSSSIKIQNIAFEKGVSNDKF